MSKPTFLINSYINDCNKDSSELCKNLFKQGIMSKQLENENLILIYNKYDDHNMSELKRECRSLILDKKTLEIKAYSCETPKLILGKETIQDSSSNIINMCYEGTLLSVFYYNNIWYISTRRCFDSSQSVFNTSVDSVSKSHYLMFEEVLSKTEYINFESFSKMLDQTKSYYFVLIHHQNKHIIDYSYRFGDKYTYLCLVSIRDSNMTELDIYGEKLSFINEYIFLPEKLNSINDFIKINEQNNYNSIPKDEGIVVKVFSPETNNYVLHKIQTDSYSFNMIIGTEKNIYKGLIYLYQHNKLIEYFDKYPTSEFIKITNPQNTYETFYTIGVIDSVFKVFTSELFELFKLICSLKTGKSQNKELYEILPKEYKNMIYGLRGLYYKKKASLFDKTGDKTNDEVKSSHMSISDIYNYLKKLHVEVINNFLKVRKLMFNLANYDNKNPLMIQFGQISKFCNILHLKQCAILTNKLHPKITSSDFPDKNKLNESIN